MAANRLEPTGSGSDLGKSTAPAEAAAAAPAPAVPAAPGLQAWLPLIVTVVAMPLLAYLTTTFFLLPKFQRALGATPPAPPAAAAAAANAKPSEGEAPAETHEGGGSKSRYSVAMKKVLVNVAGTLGTRFLVVDMTLVGANPTLDQLFRDNEPELRDQAIACLSSKAIVDLEKPGAKNLIRSELVSLFNAVLGPNVVQEIFFTEFAIQ